MPGSRRRPSPGGGSAGRHVRPGRRRPPISVTDRCNFRCTYCMPAEGLVWLPKHEILTFEELSRLLGLFVDRLDPLRQGHRWGADRPSRPAHADPDVPRGRARDRPVDDDERRAADRLAAPLAEAGLDRVTVSMDSLLRHRFEQMTRRDALDACSPGSRQPRRRVWCRSRSTAWSSGHQRRRGRRSGALVEGARPHGPVHRVHAPRCAACVGTGQGFLRPDRRRHRCGLPLIPDGPDAEPATGYRFADGAPGGIGVIGSVTEPFCESCNRLRITAEGQVRACLFALEETDLRGPLRDGASDDELVDLVRRNVWRKWSGHRINHPDFLQPERSMSAIGGWPEPSAPRPGASEPP